MKIEIVFVKDHFGGLKKGDKRTLAFLHAVRLVEEGYVKAVSQEDFDTMAESYKEQQEKIQDQVAKRLEELAKLEDDHEKKKEKLRELGQQSKAERLTSKVLMSTGDIQSEEPKNSPKGKGGKNK